MNKTCELKKLIKDIVREVLRDIKMEADESKWDEELKKEMEKSYGGTTPE